ncbi:MAG TPA: creatininase family protein [Vicinamibacterales bacterium]
MTLRRLWHEMTSADFAALDDEHVVAILPVAAIEQHGPHLPVFVDACINAELLARALDRAPANLPITALPMQAVGKSNEHGAFPGTLSLSADTLTRVCLEIGESVHRAGIRRLVLLNSHGGQPQIMDIVARELRVKHRMFVVNAAWQAFRAPAGLFSAEELQHGIHGGEVETSLMLHFRPDLVRMELAEDFVSWSREMTADFRLLTPEGRIGFGWQTQDLHPAGACGNAKAATAEKGRLVAEHAVKNALELLAEVARYPLERIVDRC